MRLSRQSVATVAACGLFGLGLGIVAAGAVADEQTPAPPSSAADSTHSDATRAGVLKPGSPDAEQSDLIAATGEDGLTGFVRREDLFPPMPANPAAAVKQTKKMVDADGRDTIPLYSADGKVRIGTYVVYTSFRQGGVKYEGN